MKPKMTYGELLELLQRLSPEQLAQTVTIYHVNDDEFHPLQGDHLMVADEEIDTLDPGHLYLAI